MELDQDLTSVFVVALIAAVTPLLVGFFRLRVAEVVLLLALGALAGPSALDLIEITDAVTLLQNLGLGFLFFVAGYELDPRLARDREGLLGGLGWLASLVLAGVTAVVLTATGVVSDSVGVAIALTSTALGTLLPMLRDRGLTRTPFGRYFMGAGAAGEFGPILAISIFLGSRSSEGSLIVLALFGVLAVAIAIVPRRMVGERLRAILELGRETSSQTPVRWTILLLVGLLALSDRFGLDVVLGAFVAGAILKLWTPAESEGLDRKVEGIAFGFFIPLFFVVSGAALDLASIAENPLRLLLFFVLLLVVRGAPQLLVYRRDMPLLIERVRFSLYVATGLPIIVAVTGLGVAAGVMLPENAAALVGAGALSVLVFPLVADLLPGRGLDPATRPLPARD